MCIRDRIGWVITTYTLAVAAMSVPFGKVADIKGRRRVFFLGIGGFVAASLLCAASINIWMLLTLRAAQGLFAAMIFATNNAILIDAHPANQRGRVLGLSTAATYVGLSAGGNLRPVGRLRPSSSTCSPTATRIT